MSDCRPITGCVFASSAFTLLARVVHGVDITQAAVASITWEVFDASKASVSSGSLVVEDVIFDTLQKDARWKKDATGYNFRHDVAASVLTVAGQYRFQHLVTLATGDSFYLTPFVVTVDEIWA
jgi:hypothetical protein